MSKPNKLLESVKLINKALKEAMSVPGDEWDDEGNYIGGGNGGRRFGRYSGYRKPYTPPVTRPAPVAAPTVGGAPNDEKTLKATRIANAIAKKKGLPSADQGLISWVMKQMDSGKFQEEENASYAFHEAKVKKELMSTAINLLETAKKKIEYATKSGNRKVSK